MGNNSAWATDRILALGTEFLKLTVVYCIKGKFWNQGLGHH